MVCDAYFFSSTMGIARNVNLNLVQHNKNEIIVIKYICSQISKKGSVQVIRHVQVPAQKAFPNKSLLNAKRQKEDKSMYRRKEASKQVQIRKNLIVNPSFFNGAPNLHKLGLSLNILHFDSWLLGCRPYREPALIQREVEASTTIPLQTRYINYQYTVPHSGYVSFLNQVYKNLIDT